MKDSNNNGWNSIKADFSGSNASMGNALKSLSNAGDIFDSISKSMEDRKNNEFTKNIQLRQNEREDTKLIDEQNKDLDKARVGEALTYSIANSTDSNGIVDTDKFNQIFKETGINPSTSAGSDLIFGTTNSIDANNATIKDRLANRELKKQELEDTNNFRQAQLALRNRELSQSAENARLNRENNYKIARASMLGRILGKSNSGTNNKSTDSMSSVDKKALEEANKAEATYINSFNNIEDQQRRIQTTNAYNNFKKIAKDTYNLTPQQSNSMFRTVFGNISSDGKLTSEQKELATTLSDIRSANPDDVAVLNNTPLGRMLFSASSKLPTSTFNNFYNSTDQDTKTQLQQMKPLETSNAIFNNLKKSFNLANMNEIQDMIKSGNVSFLQQGGYNSLQDFGSSIDDIIELRTTDKINKLGHLPTQEEVQQIKTSIEDDIKNKNPEYIKLYKDYKNFKQTLNNSRDSEVKQILEERDKLPMGD